LPERYQLREVIGTGGMGRVYRAHDTVLGRDVAVKVLDSGPGGTGGTQPRDRFVREARAAARLAHPNIVAVHDADPQAGWLVMDLVDGEALRDIGQRGPMAPREVRAIADQVLAALDTAHASGVIHRDIKPSNIIVGKTGKVTLVDFGVARLVDAEVTRTGESLGTPAYMAPEQLRGSKTDARTDLYGLAGTLFELVSGERMVAFETPSATALAKVTQLCGAEHGLAEVIVRCLRASPDERLGSAREAREMLAHRRRRGRALGLALAAVALAGGGAAFALSRMHGTHAEDPRRAELFALSQRGDHLKAEPLWQLYVAAHPDDPYARMMNIMTRWWAWGVLEEKPDEIARLQPVHRDMIHGLAMLASRHESAAIAFLEDAEHRYPNRVEIEYALGEARWHGQEIERGVETLEHAFALDGRWQIALEHVIQYRLSRGDTAPLAPYVEKLRALDPVRSATLACEIATSDRKYADAEASARAGLSKFPGNNDLYVCLLQAQILAGDLDAAAATAQEANAKAPIDLRELGRRTVTAELLLYQGKLDDYLATLPDTADRQRRITLAYWRPSPALIEGGQSSEGPRGQPLVPASQTLEEHVNGHDPTRIYANAFEAELRSYGNGLAAQMKGDLPTAAAELRRAMTAPAKGDVRMLAAHDLAAVLVAQGDVAGAKAACEEVLWPHQYLPYRAALWPDCVLWSGDEKLWAQLDRQWTGEFAHSSVIEIRRRLGK